jgi:hypothetical protein
MENTSGSNFFGHVSSHNKVQEMPSKATFADVSLPFVIKRSDAAATEHDGHPLHRTDQRDRGVNMHRNKKEAGFAPAT